MLEIESLSVSFPTGDSRSGERARVVRNVSLTVGPAEFVGLVGESGSGKTLTALSAVQLLPPDAQIDSGKILFRGVDLTALDERALRPYRGARIGFVFQEPMTALNPVLTIGRQLREAIVTHAASGARDSNEVERRALELLEQVAISDGARRMKDYPHELSGGQRQRVMIALALAAEPDLLIADEPTTALDVTIQAQVLELLAELRTVLGLSVLLITHDLGVVAQTCERVVVLYAGQVVEAGDTASVLEAPAHPYTRQLLQALPRLGDHPGDEGFVPIPGNVPEPTRLPRGCAFHPRCAERFEPCSDREPPLVALASERRAGSERTARCLLHLEGGEA